MTCRAPRGGICGSGSTLSEYELYFNYARNKFPSSVELRPLLWANGPSPGMMYVPSSGVLESDGPKRNWRSFRIAESKIKSLVFSLAILAYPMITCYYTIMLYDVD